MHPKDADWTGKHVEPDQTAPEQSDLGLHCLPRTDCPNTEFFYGIVLVD